MKIHTDLKQANDKSSVLFWHSYQYDKKCQTIKFQLPKYCFKA